MKQKFNLILMIFAITILFLGCSGKKDDLIPNKVFSLSDLPGKTIGVLSDSVADLYSTDLEIPDSGNKPCIIKRFPTMSETVDALKLGAVDCVILDSEAAFGYCDNDKTLSILDEVFLSQDYAICFSKKNNKLMNKTNEALALMEEDGKLYAAADKSNTIQENSKNLTVAVCAGFKPRCYYNSEGNLIGTDVDLIENLSVYLKCNIKIIDMDYESALSALDNGTADMAIGGITPSDFLSSTYNLSVPYRTECLMVLVRNSDA